MILIEARATDLTVTEADVATAAETARQASEHARALSEQAVRDTTITGADIEHAEQEAVLAARRADHRRLDYEQAERARRVLALAALGEKVDAFAEQLEGPDCTVLAAVQALADASRALRAGLAEHDARVAALVQEARDLDVEPATPGGPAASSAQVAVSGSAIQHGLVQVCPLGVHADEAVTLAVAGHVEAATALLVPVVRHTPRHGMRYLTNRMGVVFTFTGTLPRTVVFQLERGELAELPAELAEEWRTGMVGPPQIARFAAQAFEQIDIERTARSRRGSPERTIIEPVPFGG